VEIFDGHLVRPKSYSLSERFCRESARPDAFQKATLVKLLRCQQLRRLPAELRVQNGNVFHSLLTDSFVADNE
jgi:hypothetical protein